MPATLVKTTIVEGKLLLREPVALGFGVLFPTALLLGLGAIPALREPSEDFDGARFVDIWAPTALVLGLALLGLQHIPAVVSAYRERGILRRMSTTPVHPGTVLVAQLLAVLAAAVASAVLLVLSAWLVLDVPLPRYPGWFALVFVVGLGSLLAIGLLVAAIAPNTQTANGLAILVFMLVMLVGGVYLPRFLMPEFLVRMGDYTPPGAQLLLDSWSNNQAVAATVGGNPAGGPELLQLGIMMLIGLAAGAAAAKLFRWE